MPQPVQRTSCVQVLRRDSLEEPYSPELVDCSSICADATAGRCLLNPLRYRGGRLGFARCPETLTCRCPALTRGIRGAPPNRWLCVHTSVLVHAESVVLLSANLDSGNLLARAEQVQDLDFGDRARLLGWTPVAKILKLRCLAFLPVAVLRNANFYLLQCLPCLATTLKPADARRLLLRYSRWVVCALLHDTCSACTHRNAAAAAAAAAGS